MSLELISAIAITPLFDIRTVNVPTTGLGTDPKQAVTKTAGVDGVTHSHIRIRRATDKIHAYELLTDPVYRIDVAVEDEAYYEKLERRLDNEESYYPPSLGKSEYLCTG